MYDVGAQGVDERMLNVHYYYLFIITLRSPGHSEAEGRVLTTRVTAVIQHYYTEVTRP